MERADMMLSTYLAGRVLRYHTWPTITRETVAEHSWGVAMIYLELFGNPGRTMIEGYLILEWILKHDLAELWTGDLPFPVKLCHPPLRAAIDTVEAQAERALGVQRPNLTPLNLGRIKICDLLQMMLFGLHELRLGNQYARCIADDTAAGALDVAQKIGVWSEVKAFITKQGDNS